jgi:hypothetical protein
VKSIVAVLIVVLVTVLVPVPQAQATYAFTRISHLSTEHTLELEFEYYQSGITFLVKTADGQVTEHYRGVVNWVGNYIAWVDLPDEEVEVSFLEPIWLSESLWQDYDGDGWFTWMGGRLKSYISCREGGTPHILILGKNLGGETWMLGSGNNMNSWPLMYNNGQGGLWDYGYGTYQGYITNIKTYETWKMVPGETLWFTVFSGNYGWINYLDYQASIAVIVPKCPIETPVPTATPEPTSTPVPTSTPIPPSPTWTPTLTATPTPIIIAPPVPPSVTSTATATQTPTRTPLPTPIATWTPSPVPPMVVYHVYLPLVIQ